MIQEKKYSNKRLVVGEGKGEKRGYGLEVSNPKMKRYLHNGGPHHPSSSR